MTLLAVNDVDGGENVSESECACCMKVMILTDGKVAG